MLVDRSKHPYIVHDSPNDVPMAIDHVTGWMKTLVRSIQITKALPRVILHYMSQVITKTTVKSKRLRGDFQVRVKLLIVGARIEEKHHQ